ncbi:replication protein A 32 kDa subunit [Amia ocellicauda]|uniref:replication protein A 32 kDa subunit n=1 Tax=Amia ocellicauda TaxID=2972642 RepID=UPI003464109A
MWNQGYNDSSMGGGYTQSPGGFASPGASQGEKKTRTRSQQIVPCTVSQLMSASQAEDVFKVGGVEVSQVTLVGIIRNAEKAPTNVLYKVDDMTGPPMDIRQWVDTDEAGRENIVVPPGTYVKVCGHLRSFQGKTSVVAFKVRPLEDMNELISHMLEVVHAHMQLSKAQTMMVTDAMNQSLVPTSSNIIATMGGGYSGASDAAMNGLTPHQSQVLNLIKACADQQGVGIQDLKLRLKAMSLATIKQAVEFLSNEGHIYSTIDEDHFRATDNE